MAVIGQIAEQINSNHAYPAKIVDDTIFLAKWENASPQWLQALEGSLVNYRRHVLEHLHPGVDPVVAIEAIATEKYPKCGGYLKYDAMRVLFLEDLCNTIQHRLQKSTMVRRSEA